MGCAVVELFRLSPADGETADARPVTGSAPPATMLVYNPLSAPIYFRFDTAADPTALDHDLACPGSAVMSWPIDPSIQRIAAVVDYPGAVPIGDVADAVIRITPAQLPPGIWPLT